jgi:ketosteroid isomerase-like protein
MTVDNMSEDSIDRATLISLTQLLLESIANGNWERYSELCDPSLTCFEPEAQGHMVAGMDFHRFYFDLKSSQEASQVNTTMATPHVRIMGDIAIVAYVRLVQRLDSAGVPFTIAFEETRVWQKQSTKWQHVHFHRSVPPQ